MTTFNWFDISIYASTQGVLFHNYLYKYMIRLYNYWPHNVQHRIYVRRTYIIRCCIEWPPVSMSIQCADIRHTHIHSSQTFANRHSPTDIRQRTFVTCKSCIRRRLNIYQQFNISTKVTIYIRSALQIVKRLLFNYPTTSIWGFNNGSESQRHRWSKTLNWFKLYLMKSESGAACLKKFIVLLPHHLI